MQERRNSIALAIELRLPYTNLSISCYPLTPHQLHNFITAMRNDEPIKNNVNNEESIHDIPEGGTLIDLHIYVIILKYHTQLY